ncbi:hypothetical protein KN198_17840 (plasmid) [Ralstonia solanacearum]|nr:hypothetical protein KN198_17840 [Ralstonia solanacearum]
MQRFLSRPRRPRDGAIRLDRRHVYILPTATGAGFALLLVAMLLTSLNYNVSLGFLLTFLLAGVMASAMWQTHRNLVDLEVRGAVGEPVFAGRAVNVSVALANATAWARVGVETGARDAASAVARRARRHADGAVLRGAAARLVPPAAPVRRGFRSGCSAPGAMPMRR